MTTRALRLRVYLELLLRLRRKQRTRDRIQFLKQNPDAINEQDFDMLAETSGRSIRYLFEAHPHLRARYIEHCENPQNILSSLSRFTAQAYRHTGLPGEYRGNWHIDLLAGQYERLHRGEVDRIMVNVPPSTAKSVLANVFLPAWIWAQTPEWGIANFSYSDVIPNRDRETLSRLIHSEWYRKRFGDRFRLTHDSARLMRTSKGGWRYGGGVGGGGTGLHPHLIVIDDPHKAIDIGSKTEMLNVARWFANTISTRGMLLKARILLLMQRLAMNDLCGVILQEGSSGAEDLEADLAEELNEKTWLHLCLPMHYSPDHRYPCEFDPRTQRGQLLWPEMIPEQKVRRVMREMALAGEPNVSAQFEQDPLATGGRIFESVDNARIRYDDLQGLRLEHGRTVRSWDKADSDESQNLDPSAGVLMNQYGNQKTILHVITARKRYAERDDMIVRVAVADKSRWDNYRVVLEKSPGPDGNLAFSLLREKLQKLGIDCMAQNPSKSKILRATPLAAAIKYGEVRVLDGQDWTDSFLQELRLFPNVDHDDRTDAAAHGYNALCEWEAGKI